MPMEWPVNAPEDETHRAIFVLEETRGIRHTIAFLMQELNRLRVVDQHRTSTRQLVAAEQRVSEAERRLTIVSDALEFYADADNYKSRSGKPSAIERDNGRTARDAFQAIEPEGENGDGQAQ